MVAIRLPPPLVLEVIDEDTLNKSGNTFCQLVCGRARSFMDLFDELWSSPEAALVVALAPEDLREFLSQTWHALVGLKSSGFRRRIVDRIVKLPHTICTLGERGRLVKCTDRQAWVAEFLDMSEADLDSNSLKIRRKFTAAFEHMRATGTVTLGLWRFIQLYRRTVLISAKVCEGANSLVKAEATRSPIMRTSQDSQENIPLK